MKIGGLIICLLMLLSGCGEGQRIVGEKPYFVRGLLMEEPFPENRKAWSQLIESCKEYGFNYMKLAIDEIPDEAFAVAEELDFCIGTDSILLTECDLAECGYPDINRPGFEQVRRSLREQGLEGLTDDFVFSCGRTQILLLKKNIEKILYDKGIQGFLLRGWRDCPKKNQVGILNEDGTGKKYISAGEFNCFCSPVVVLFPMEKQVFANDEMLKGELKIVNGTDSLISRCCVEWRLKERNGKIWKADTLQIEDIPASSSEPLGGLNIPLTDFERPVQLSLEIRVGDYFNNWYFSVYPKEQFSVGDIDNIKVVSRLDTTVLGFLNKGGKLLFAPKIEYKMSDFGRNVLCNPVHPAFGLFPTFSYTTTEWKDILQYAKPVDLEEFNGNYRPIVRLVDSPERNHSLALLLEARVGKGKILLSGCDFTTDMEQRPASRQLLCSLKSYMASELFCPSFEMGEEELKKMTDSLINGN